MIRSPFPFPKLRVTLRITTPEPPQIAHISFIIDLSKNSDDNQLTGRTKFYRREGGIAVNCGTPNKHFAFWRVFVFLSLYHLAREDQSL